MFKNKPIKKIFFGILLSAAIMSGFLIAQNAIAQGTEQLLAYTLPINNYLWDICETLLNQVVWIMFSGYALQTTLMNPQWISINNVFVKTGLDITTALADILLIAVFVAIAIGFVFKIETFNSEKVLPKFFIAALLVHFGPLFVGMMIDISNIAMSSLLVGDDTIIMDTCREFASQLFNSARSIIIKFAADAVLAVLPVLGPAKMVRNLFMLLGVNGWILVQLPVIIVQIMTSQIFSAIMFSHAVFFMTRVFMMQILAVLSPLAILASILPQTKHLFSTWLKWLFGWAAAGILAMFLITLGLSTLKSLMPTITDNAVNLSGGLTLFLRPDSMYWLMISIYLLAVDGLIAVSIPEISKNIEKKLKGSVAAKNPWAKKESDSDRQNKKIAELEDKLASK